MCFDAFSPGAMYEVRTVSLKHPVVHTGTQYSLVHTTYHHYHAINVERIEVGSAGTLMNLDHLRANMITVIIYFIYYKTIDSH